MPKLTWDVEGTRVYEAGTSKGVLYDGATNKGVAWTGLSAIKQASDGAESTDIFADNIKYLSLTSKENFKGSIEAYTYPDEFAKCDGSAEVIPGVTAGQQTRRSFGLCYRTEVGNDVDGLDHGYKLHIVYQAKVAPSSRDYETVNADPAALTLSWEFDTTPQVVDEKYKLKPTAYFCLDSTKTDEAIMKKVEAALYGTDEKPAELPKVNDLLKLIKP